MSLAPFFYLPRIYPCDEAWTRRSCSYIANILLGRRSCLIASRNCASYFAFSFEAIFILFSILHDEMWSGNSIVCPSSITVIPHLTITSLHGAATTVLFNILSAIIATYRLCKLWLLPITGVLFTV